MKTIIYSSLFLFLSVISYAQDSDIEYAYKWKNEIISTSAPRLEGESYRIELLQVRSFNPNDPDLKMLKKYGNIYPEKNLKNGMIRLTLGDFKEEEKASPILKRVRSMGFTNSSLIKYLDGFRQE